MSEILCVEDSPEEIQILRATLREHPLSFASTLKEARELLERVHYALVLLDIQLPDGNGLELMTAIVDRTPEPLVIMLTGNQDFASKASAFSLGAEDFIVKPFDSKELKVRVNAKLRKASLSAENCAILRLGNLICRVSEHRLYTTTSHQVINLTALEFRIFHLLAQRPNKVFTRAEILDRVWSHSISVIDRAVDVHISNVRRKLQGTGVTIAACVGTGYRLIVEKPITPPFLPP